jgi:hypothetical protein
VSTPTDPLASASREADPSDAVSSVSLEFPAHVSESIESFELLELWCDEGGSIVAFCEAADVIVVPSLVSLSCFADCGPEGGMDAWAGDALSSPGSSSLSLLLLPVADDPSPEVIIVDFLSISCAGLTSLLCGNNFRVACHELQLCSSKHNRWLVTKRHLLQFLVD